LCSGGTKAVDSLLLYCLCITHSGFLRNAHEKPVRQARRCHGGCWWESLQRSCTQDINISFLLINHFGRKHPTLAPPPGSLPSLSYVSTAVRFRLFYINPNCGDHLVLPLASLGEVVTTFVASCQCQPGRQGGFKLHRGNGLGVNDNDEQPSQDS